VRITPGDLDDPRVRALLEHHLRSALAVTPRGSAHALDVSGLKAPGIRFWTAWDGETLLGTGALKQLPGNEGEVKSMHTLQSRRRSGVGMAMLMHIIDNARALGMKRLNLETGSFDYFMPARALYSRAGFTECGPFAGYVKDPNSTFMTLRL
jgi:putative acetyltransferase